MIISVTGRADGFDLVFQQTAAGAWEAIVPADMSDGMYVVDIWAQDQSGNVAYYTGILYMFDGRVTRLELVDDQYACQISPSRFCLLPAGADFEMALQPDAFSVTWSERAVVILGR